MPMQKDNMPGIAILKADITHVDADAIVNAANEGLRAGGGVCGAIFDAAGHRDLQRACDEIGHCETGDAVITPGFELTARHVIHAVGPRWHGGEFGEAELLASCYGKAIDLAVENGCASVAFPLISSGIFGYPKEEAWRVAIGACLAKLDQLGERAPKVAFCVLSESSRQMGEEILRELSASACRGG